MCVWKKALLDAFIKAVIYYYKNILIVEQYWEMKQLCY